MSTINHQLYLKVTPNPFSSFTTIPGREKEKVAVYNISGQKVGEYLGSKVGGDLPSGVYFALVGMSTQAGSLCHRMCKIVKLR
ncbi:MAG: T9SS type A sorting domain-containing protein [Candidatus Edwardsbacteria bacterium]